MAGSRLGDWRGILSRGAILLFLVLAAHQAAKPLHLDNMDFPAAAEATAQSGKPIYYRGEENPKHSGLYHPPLYIYTLAGWFRIFGSGPAQVRMFGALCAILQGWLALRLLGSLCGEERVRQWRWLFWPLFLLNPYTLQGSAIADIDTTIYGPLLTLALWSTIRIAWRDGHWRKDEPRHWETALLALSLTAALWAKLTTVFLLFPFLFFLLAPRLGWKRAIVVTVGVSTAGLGEFLLTYYLYGSLTQLDVRDTFRFLRVSMLGAGRLLNYRANFMAMAPFVLKWTGLLPWLSVSVVLAAAAWRWWHLRERRALYYFWALSLSAIGVAYYCAQVMTFARAPFKYTFVFWALLTTAPVLLIAWLGEAAVARHTDHANGQALMQSRALILFGAAAWLAGLWTGAVAVRDDLLIGSVVYPQGLSLWVPAGVTVAGLLAWGTRRRGPMLVGAGLAASALLLHAGIQAGIALHQSRVEYSTTYDYGQTGLQEAAVFVSANTTEQDVISSMKDVGFRAKRRYYENYGALYEDEASAQRLIAAWESGRVRYIVFTEGIGQDQLAVRPRLRDWIAANADLVASFGDYRIYEPRAAVRRLADGTPQAGLP